jgi:hypothetical protein
MVQTRNMLINRKDSTSGSDMDISPRTDTIPALTNFAHNEEEETNTLALQPHKPTEPTLLEITEPDITFEALSS